MAAVRPGYRVVLDVRPDCARSGFDEVTLRYGYPRTGPGLSGRDLRARHAQPLAG